MLNIELKKSKIQSQNILYSNYYNFIKLLNKESS